jgi:hypothetical protein
MQVKILGYDRFNDEFYQLGYCEEKDADKFIVEEVKNGWRELDLRIEEV